MHLRTCHGKTARTFTTDKADIVIGRHAEGGDPPPDLDLSADRRVSRRHARLWIEKGQCWIEDLGSKHGTKVAQGGKEVEIKGKGKVGLSPGAVLTIGETTLKVEAGHSPALPVAVDNRKPEVTPGTAADGAVRPASEVRVTIRCVSSLNYSLVHLGVPVITEVVCQNPSASEFRDLALDVSLEQYASLARPIEISCLEAHARRVTAGKEIPQLQFDRDRLAQVHEPRSLAMSALLNAEPAPLESPLTLRLLPPNAWYWPGHHEALAGFVMPKSRAVSEVVSRARGHLRRLMQTESFADALGSSDPLRVDKVVQAIYDCLHEQYAVAYENEPRSYDADWQIVRFHHEVLHELKGTCIDLALLLGACLEHVHLDPMILIVRTSLKVQHALVACWREGSLGKRTLHRQGGPILGQVQQGQPGAGILLLDSVGYARGQFADLSFGDCHTSGLDHLTQACAARGDYRFRYALEVCSARRRGIMPMPFGEGLQFDKASALAVFMARESAAELSSPVLTARHLFLGLLSLEAGSLARLLTRLGGDVGALQKATAGSLERAKRPPRILPESDDWQAIMRRIEATMKERNKLLVTESDLAQALLETPTKVDVILQARGPTRERCLAEFQAARGEGGIPSGWRATGFSECT